MVATTWIPEADEAVERGNHPWSTKRWAEALVARYFATGFSQEPVTYCADADELASIRGLPAAEAVEELSSVVRQQVMPGHSYSGLWRQCQRWRDCGCDGPPPSLPLLALNVLAASLMTAQGVGAANFYKPYRQLLDPTDDQPGMPGNYDHYVPRMWEQLSWWLNEYLGGERGISTITRHEHFVNIGYARQQAVLHASDRRRLHRFLRSIGFEPGDDVVPDELRRALAIWARRLGSVGERLMRFATDQSLEPYASELLRRVAEGWDGKTRDPRTGAIALPIRLLIEDRPFAVGLVVQREEDDPIRVELMFGGAAVQLSSEGAFYSPAPIPLDLASILDSGIELSGNVASLTFDPASIHPLVYDDTLAGWVSVNGISFGEVQCLLVRKEALAGLQSWIADEGLSGGIDTAATRHLPDGWFLIRRFRIDARPRHRPPADVADLLGSSGGARTRLVGGLSVGGLRRTYLMGGLPFLAIPSDEDSVPVELEMNGSEAVRLRADKGELSLNMINLGPGVYRVAHPRGRLEFDVVEGMSRQPGSAVGSVCLAGVDGRPVQGLVAAVPAPRAPVAVAVPAEGTCVVLGPRCGDVALIETPRWLRGRLGELSWDATDVWCDFDPVWLITLGGTYMATLIEAREPLPGPAGSSWEGIVMRAQLASGDDAAIQLWQRYRDLAGGS